MANFIDKHRREIAWQLARDGKSVREIAKGAGIAKETAHRIKKRVRKAVTVADVIEYAEEDIRNLRAEVDDLEMVVKILKKFK